MIETITTLHADPMGRWLVYLVGGILALVLLGILVPVTRSAVWGILAPLFRFFTGQIITRRPGQWDSRWESWAPEVPENVKLMRGQVYPYSTWARRPGWQRQLVRIGALITVMLWTAHPALMTVAVVLIAVPAGARWELRRRRRIRYERLVGRLAKALGQRLFGRDANKINPHEWITPPRGEWVWVPANLPLYGWLSSTHPRLERFPLTRKLAGLLSALSTNLRRAQEWVSATIKRPSWVSPMDLSDPNAEIYIHYGEDLAFDEVATNEVSSMVSALLPGSWKVYNRPLDCYWCLSHPTYLPNKVELTTEHLERYRYPEVFFGRERDADAVLDLKRKTPHVSISASTGWGKTTIANVMLAALLRWGAFAVILDPKRIGYVTAFDQLPNVRLCTTLEGQIAAFDLVRAEMERRYELIETYMKRAIELGLPDMKEYPELYFRPLVLVDDEKGSLTTALKQEWKAAKNTGTPQALIDQQVILWQGRAACVHNFTLAQQNNLDVYLNSDMRDQYMAKIAAGPQTPSSYRMTFGGKMKRVISKKGRALYGIGPMDPTDVQLAYTSDEFAREAAIAGIEISNKEDLERAERLSLLTDAPLWEVSPLAPWMPVPEEMASSVPGQQAATGTDGPIPAQRTAPEMHILQGGCEETEDSIFERYLVIVSNIDESTSPQNPGEDTATAPGGVSDTQENAENDDEKDWVIGLDAAATHLGYNTTDAFKKARQRAAKANNPIPSETRRDGVVRWLRTDLEEWHSKLPRAGARTGLDAAVGND